jgi:trk system potassium uptake protein TrkA
MGQQFAVIGLGAFGTAIALELTRNGGEVIAVDRDIQQVERIKDEVAYAIRLDATDPKVLEAQDIHQVDVAIIAIGNDFEASVLIAVELMQLGVKRIMARAESATQKKILERLGVSDVLSPEEEVAKYVARRLLNPEIVDLFRLSDDYSIVEVRAPERFFGNTLKELQIRQRYHCNVIAIKRPPASQGDTQGTQQYRLLVPLPQTTIETGDTLIVLGLAADIERLTAQ